MNDLPNLRQRGARTRDLAHLKTWAARLRCHILEMVALTGQGYVQQGLGAAELLTVLYFAELRLDPGEPAWPGRDRFIMSTAHNTAVFYAAMAERGFFSVERLRSYCQDGSALEINASERMGPVVEATCGSLGQGLSVGAGMAAALREQGQDARVYVLLGDGEMQEGQVWEAAMCIGGWGLGNLCVVLDSNRMQVEGQTHKVFHMDPLREKWVSFGFAVEEVDGHNFAALLGALDRAREQKRQPSCIIANTVVGKGVPSLEGMFAHQLKFPPDVARRAMQELGMGVQE